MLSQLFSRIVFSYSQGVHGKKCGERTARIDGMVRGGRTTKILVESSDNLSFRDLLSGCWSPDPDGIRPGPLKFIQPLHGARNPSKHICFAALQVQSEIRGAPSTVRNLMTSSGRSMERALQEKGNATKPYWG